MNGKKNANGRARRNGFYLALAVCLVAVGIAAWSTYDAVQSYTAAGEESEHSSQLALENEDVRKGQEESRQTVGTVSQAPRATSTPSPTPAPTAKPKVTAAPKPTAPPEPEATAPEVPATAPLYERSSSMVWPLASEELQKLYSNGAPVYSETMKDWRIHTGADQVAQAGEEVHACANGQVKKTYTDAMLGNVIVVEHGDYEFSYCGVGEDFQVKEGDVVTKGQAIGTVTAVPCEAAEKPHLHIEVRRDGVCLDPQDVIAGKS